MEKVLALAQQVIVQIKTLTENLLQALIRYIRSKTKDLPVHIPKGKAETIASLMGRSSFREFLSRHAQESGFTLEQVEQNARRYLDEIAADMNYLAFPFWDFILTWAFQTLYEGLVVDTESLEKIRPVIGQRPIVFVSNHRSHMDYLLLSYVNYYHRFPMPHIAGGINLSFWPFGWLARKSGCFFIRRSFEGNRLYAACVRFYLQEQLQQNNTIGVFIEGTRSRTGKLLPPRMGILSFLADAYLNEATEDVLLIPTSFTYESILEEKSYLREQTGATKKDETIWDLLRIRQYLKKRQGKVYIRFGEPVSLHDSLEGCPPEQKRLRVKELAQQLTYGINKSLVVTSVSLASLTLLGHRHRVMSWDEFWAHSSIYLDYLKYKGSPLSDPLRKFPEAALRESLRQFKLKGLIEEYEDEGQSFYHVVEAKRGHLDYYKNNSIHYFVSLSVLCRILEGTPDLTALPQLEEDYRFLQELFRYEFTFSWRQPLTEHLGKLLEYLDEKKAITIGKEGIKGIDPSSLRLFSVLLQNFFESYWIAWRTLPSLGIRRWERRDLLKWFSQKGKILYLREEVHTPEANFVFNLQNALQSFSNLGFLKPEQEGWGKKTRTYFQRTDNEYPRIAQLERLLNWAPTRPVLQSPPYTYIHKISTTVDKSEKMLPKISAKR